MNFSRLVYVTARDRIVCAGHTNHDRNGVHVCDDIRIVREIRQLQDRALADDDTLTTVDAVFPGGCNAGDLDGIKKPISSVLRTVGLAPRLVTEAFAVTTCEPRPRCCPLCEVDMESIFDAAGVVLFGNGQQVGVLVHQLQCKACNTRYPYEGDNDKLVVMERRQNGGTTTIIIVDEHWLAELVRGVYLSKDSFTDIYTRLEVNRALICDGTGATIQSSIAIDISKTKLIQIIWQAMTHLYPIPPSALSCITCGSAPNVVVFDGVAIGLLETLISKRRFHTVSEDQRHFPKVSPSLFVVMSYCTVLRVLFSFSHLLPTFVCFLSYFLLFNGQMLYKTCLTFAEMTLLPPGKSGLQICEEVHFLANCTVRGQAMPGHAEPLPTPFTFGHFRSLLEKVDAEATRDRDGPCAALQYTLCALYRSTAAFTFPQQPAGADDDDIPGVPEAAPNPQAPVTGFEMLQPLLHTFACKSAASITGAPAAAIIFSFGALASGHNALCTEVPKMLLTLNSAADLASIRSAKYLQLLNAGLLQEASDFAFRTNPTTDRRTAFAARTNVDAANLTAVFLPIGIDVSGAGAADYNHLAPPPNAATAFVQRVLHQPLLSLINHVELTHATTPDDIDFSGYRADEKPVTVLDILGRAYPALHSFLYVLQQQHILPIDLTPVLAHLAVKVCTIYLRDYTYIVAKSTNSLGVPIVDPRHYLPPFRHSTGSFDCFSITSLIAEHLMTPVGIQQIADINLLKTRKEAIINMLGTIRDTCLFQTTTARQDQRCGAATSLNARRVLKAEYVNDLVNKNNAYKMSYNNPFRAGAPGMVKVCEKEFPVSKHFSPGIQIAACGCPKRKVYHANFMDQYESPLSPFEILLNRFPNGCPPYVVYDNACHLLMYCMQREPSWFWACRFVVDKFHEPNHVQSCSSSIHASSYTSGPLYKANTQAVEQVNKVLRARLETRLRFMNLDHAVVFLNQFLAQFNLA